MSHLLPDQVTFEDPRVQPLAEALSKGSPTALKNVRPDESWDLNSLAFAWCFAAAGSEVGSQLIALMYPQFQQLLRKRTGGISSGWHLELREDFAAQQAVDLIEKYLPGYRKYLAEGNTTKFTTHLDGGNPGRLTGAALSFTEKLQTAKEVATDFQETPPHDSSKSAARASGISVALVPLKDLDWAIDRIPESDVQIMRDWANATKSPETARAVRVTILLRTRVLLRNCDDVIRSFPDDDPEMWRTLAAAAEQIYHDQTLTPRHRASELNRLAADVLGIKVRRVEQLLSQNRWRLWCLNSLADFVAFPDAGPNFFDNLFQAARREYRCGTDDPERFAPQELEQLENQSHRVLMMTMSGLWKRCPDAEWSNWIRKPQIKPPCPPDDFDPEASGTNRAECLADCFDSYGGPERMRNTEWPPQQLKVLQLESVAALLRRRRA